MNVKYRKHNTGIVILFFETNKKEKTWSERRIGLL
uniref:Uncharacterized protein n=1 Tax=Anguilla anguilla TaxID=7936 RepID=A0A0E9TZH2_ANGAN